MDNNNNIMGNRGKKKTIEHPLICYSQVLPVCNAAFSLTEKGLHCSCKKGAKSSDPIMMATKEIKRVVAGVLEQGGKQHVT